ncbi:uncharacterized protein si:ch211-276i12.4 [Silurus meridionalis]|uniref:uncharacterized protein si:ch211-276i12.4 n=1 Tax=Silurus meridionalis TaxID=175797 RepID=UPI001EEA582D|nr:uncharacterized protein si:ch211-276i12.4 [Silurus meridionalis]
MKRQMGRYLIPTCKPSKDELKLQKHQHLFLNQDVPHHHPNQHNSRRSSGNNTDHPQHTGGTEPHKRQLNTHPTALISSFSSSASSSTSLLSESSLENDWHFQLKKSQHSVSCSNLPEARIFLDDALRNSDFNLSDSTFSVQPYQQKQQYFGHSEKQQQVSELGLGKSPLYRSHSKNVEELLQGVSQECSPVAHGTPDPLEIGQLYKTISLGQNLGVNDKSAATVNMTRPKRAVSSIQIPSKGILKNKDGGPKHGNVRKAKSMEALSSKRQISGPYKQGSVEAFRYNFVKEKIEFSAFLDEITRQVIRPSRLNSFRLNPNPTPPSHKLSHEGQRQPGKASNQEPEHVQKSNKQHSIRTVKSDIKKGRTDLNNYGHKCITGSISGTLDQHQQQRSQAKQQSTPENYSATAHKEPHRKYSQLLNEGTSTSSESITQVKHSQAKSEWGNNGGGCREVNSENNASSLPAGLGIEFTKKSSMVNTPSMENINRHRYMGYRRHSKQSHRDSVSSMDKAQLLEQYNSDLHENLLQLVSCIENMEAELQFTKTELGSVKENCKRLQEDYQSCQQANNVLEQKLQSVMDSMNSQQKDHLHRISELNKQLETGKHLIISLEDINIPSLIKELLDNHFDSKDALKNFLLSSSARSQPDTDNSNKTLGVRDNQSSPKEKDDRVSVGLVSKQGDSTDRQEHVAAFWPWVEGQDPGVTLKKDRCKCPPTY